jgi:pimeloyl-ACP methyl ester carboxylesterase
LVALTPVGARLPEAEWQELRAAFDVPNRAAARELLDRMFTKVPWPMLFLVDDLLALWRGVPMRKLLDSIRPDRDFLSPEDLARIRVPSLLRWAAEDRLLPASALAYYRRHLPETRIEVQRGWGHGALLERPRELLDQMVPFALGLRKDSNPESR